MSGTLVTNSRSVTNILKLSSTYRFYEHHCSGYTVAKWFGFDCLFANPLRTLIDSQWDLQIKQICLCSVIKYEINSPFYSEDYMQFKLIQPIYFRLIKLNHFKYHDPHPGFDSWNRIFCVGHSRNYLWISKLQWPSSRCWYISRTKGLLFDKRDRISML